MARYKEVREIIARELASGLYPVGGKFPTDLELCERFGVSRFTVREAVRELQEQGLLRRQKGAGTVVAAAQPPAVYVQSIESLDRLDRYASEAHFEKHNEGVVTPHAVLADLLGVGPGGKWLRLAGVRRLRDHDTALCWTELYLSEPYIEARSRLVAGGEPYFEQLRRLYGTVVSHVDQTIRAFALAPDIAQVLDAEPNAPALMVRRQYFADTETPFEVSLSLHPSDRYAYTARLSRDRLW